MKSKLKTLKIENDNLNFRLNRLEGDLIKEIASIGRLLVDLQQCASNLEGNHSTYPTSFFTN